MKPTAAALEFPGPIGLGTWKMGESASARAREIAAVAHALRTGYRLVDTAEMYGDGGAERVIGAALGAVGRARRPELFIVSKVLPQNASRAGTVRACEASIERMGCDYLDLYLLHWRGQHPFEDTLEAFAGLTRRGLIRNFGVSNFDIDDLAEWKGAEGAVGLPGATQCNQVYYCLEARAIEFDLLPWQRERGIRTMAYAPLGSGDLARHRELQRIGAERGATAAQVALAWCIRTPDVVAIPKSVEPGRLDENLRAAELRLTEAEIARIDHVFRPPRSKRPLAMT
jgi:diketogulonate reductase-like aldo/keto reductase